MLDRSICVRLFRFTVALVGLGLSQMAAADTVRLDEVGSFQTESYRKNVSLGGVVVTGSSTLSVLELNGLSVMGGFSDLDIDSGESVSLTFVDALATALSLQFSRISNPNGIKGTPVTIEAFGINDQSYGAKLFSIGASTVLVSSAFGDVPIARLIFTSGEDGHMLSQVHYDPIPVPEPSDWALLGAGLSLLVLRVTVSQRPSARLRRGAGTA